MKRFVGLTFPAGYTPDQEHLRLLQNAISSSNGASSTWSADGVWFSWSDPDAQPATIDGNTFIVGHVLLCARAALLDELHAAGVDLPPLTSDHLLILHAYRIWKSRFCDHLKGEYAFALWDGESQTVFCVRDQLGVRVLYHARAGDDFVFSNDLAAVLEHPGVSRAVDDGTIGDFLICGFSLDHQATPYRAVRRVAAGHVVEAHFGSVVSRKYYELPRDGYIRYQREADYADHLTELLRNAVADRLPSEEPVAIRFSGGMDSTSIAATVREIAPHLQLKGFTAHYERVMPSDQEHVFAQAAADFIGMPLETINVDDVLLLADDTGSRDPHLQHDVLSGNSDIIFERMLGHANISLSGDTGDHLFLPPYDAFRNALKRGAFVYFVREASRFIRRFQYLPPLGVRTTLDRVRGRHRLSLPEWINPDFARETGLNGRYESGMATSTPHPLRERAHRLLAGPLPASSLFEPDYATATRYGMESRHPYSDTRLIEFLLAMPGTPWMFHKLILREAMRGRLPEVVRTRPKSPLPQYCVAAVLRDRGGDFSFVGAAAGIERYIDVSRHPARAAAGLDIDAYAPFLNTTAVSLARWLTRQRSL